MAWGIVGRRDDQALLFTLADVFTSFVDERFCFAHANKLTINQYLLSKSIQYTKYNRTQYTHAHSCSIILLHSLFFGQEMLQGQKQGLFLQVIIFTCRGKWQDLTAASSSSMVKLLSVSLLLPRVQPKTWMSGPSFLRSVSMAADRRV